MLSQPAILYGAFRPDRDAGINALLPEQAPPKQRTRTGIRKGLSVFQNDFG